MGIRIFPLSPSDRIRQNIMRNNGMRVAQGVRPENNTENWYRRQLLEYLAAMNEDLNNRLITQLRAQEMEYAQDNFIADFNRTLSAMRDRWLIGDELARRLASTFVGRMDSATKQRIERSVGKALGVDVAQMIESERLTDSIDSAISENVRLIKTIPEQFLERVERIVSTETIKGRTATSIIEQIREVYPVSINRARVIARDQSNKVNGDLTRERQTAIGIRAYRWRTVGDEAVREDHRKRNGKVFAWRPEDVGKKLADGTVLRDPTVGNIGHPGEDIQCRCIAEPIIELDRLI